MVACALTNKGGRTAKGTMKIAKRHKKARGDSSFVLFRLRFVPFVHLPRFVRQSRQRVFVFPRQRSLIPKINTSLRYTVRVFNTIGLLLVIAAGVLTVHAAT